MTSEAPKEKKVFVRDATGLVRSLSPFDLFNLSFGQIMPAVGIVFIVSLSPFAFPQSNMFLAFLIAIPLVGLGPALLYSMLGAAMPRTGGDYVYVSRVIHPALGFMTNWLFTVTVISFIADAGFVFPSSALNIFVATIGQMTGNQSLVSNSAWFTTHTGELVTGTILIVGVTILMVLGRAVWNFMKILFFIVMIGSIVNIIYLLTVSNATFITTFNNMFASQGVTYNGLIQSAVSAGYKTGWTLSGTIGGLVYAMAGLIGFNFAAYSGGEAKSSSKSVPIAIVGSLLVGGILFALWAFGIYNAFGYDFFSATNYLANCGCSSVTLPIPVSVNSLFTILQQNPVLEILGALAFGLAWIWLTPTDFIPVVRNMFAWSFDRVGPERLADVNPRFGSPVKAIILTSVIGEILLVLFIYTSFPTAFANTTILLNLVFFITSFSGILLPYRAKSVFEQAPGWVKAKIGNVPVIVLVGIFSAIVQSILLYGSFTNAFIGGAPASYPIAAGLAIGGLVIFYVARAYRRRQGINLDLVFKEIPPE
ncbi:MAG: APC family permease [Nitrososphaerales archaeon]